jgi:hypothetical protein
MAWRAMNAARLLAAIHSGLGCQTISWPKGKVSENCEFVAAMDDNFTDAYQPLEWQRDPHIDAAIH